MTAWHLLRPEWLLALLPLAVLVWRMAKPMLEHSNWSRVCDPHLLPHILHQPRHGAAQWAPWWVALAGMLLIFAMAGPVWQQYPQPVFHTRSALVLLLDLSSSMDATDLKPSRLVRAKHKIIDLLRKNWEGQTAFLVFAGNAFVVTPLTHDTATITAQLSSLDTALMPVQGSRPDRAIEKAIELLAQGGVAHGDILLMTDEWAGDEQMASRVAKEGHRLTILGVGTPEGAPVPLVDGGFLEDVNGTLIMAKLDLNQLQKLARLGGGGYQSIQADDQDIEALLQRTKQSDWTAGVKKMEVMADIWREEGPWLVLVVLPFAALVFRRGIFLWLALLLWMPGVGHTMEWESLWSRPDQQAMQLWEAGKMSESAKQFQNLDWQGAAHYRTGQYEAAVAAWQESNSTEALYNAGTALAKLGRLEESAQALLEVLKRQPDHLDAKHNLEAIQQAMNPPSTQEDKAGQQNQQKKSDQKPQPTKPGQQPEGDKQGAESAKSAKEKSQKQGQESAKEQGDDAKQQQNKQTEGVEQRSVIRERAEKGEEPPLGNASDKRLDTPEKEENQTLQELEALSQDKESRVATEQWLRRVPDDPGGLLRRKFRYQYQREGAQGRMEEGIHPW